MKAIEFISEEQVNELSNFFVNDAIRKDKSWKKVGRGYTASVWTHFSQPDTVVKVVGGGEFYERKEGFIQSTLAFVHFLVDHGYKSKHLPIVHGINIDDDEVLQIRMERLKPVVNEGISYRAHQAAQMISMGSDVSELGWDIGALDRELDSANLSRQNDATDIVRTIKLLKDAAPIYARAHKIDHIRIDLHKDNWLMRQDGTVIAADPWVAF